jgi:hypothetical protein
VLGYGTLSFGIRALFVLASWLSGGCTVTPVGELTDAICSNMMDDDDDGQIDCKDPDCLTFATCRDPIDVPTRDAGSEPIEFPDAGTPPPPPPVDASYDAGPEDGGQANIDAAVPPCTPGSCALGEECVNGSCLPPVAVTGATYEISVQSAVVPQFSSPGVCLDDCLPIPLVCLCQPDPYVIVTLSRGTQTFTVGVTDWVSNTTQPTWSGKPMTVEIRDADQLFFQAFDYDPDEPDPEILRCKPDLSQIPTGSLVCGSTAGHIDAVIVPIK